VRGIGICEDTLTPGRDAELAAAFCDSGLTATICLAAKISVRFR